MENKKYFNKYIKYKLKYLSLKNNQKGSASSSLSTTGKTDDMYDPKPSAEGKILKLRKAQIKEPSGIRKALLQQRYPGQKKSSGIAYDLMLSEESQKFKGHSGSAKYFITNIKDREDNVKLTIYTIAYNLLKRLDPLLISTLESDPLSLDKLKKCIVFFYKLSESLIDSIKDYEFINTTEREPVIRFIEKCKLEDENDFIQMLNSRYNKYIPMSDEEYLKIELDSDDESLNNKYGIDYNQTIEDLTLKINMGKVNIKTDDIEKLKQKLIKLLTNKN